MRSLLLFASILFLTKVYSTPVEESSRESWRIIKNSPLFSCSAEFNFRRGEIPDGKAIRTGLFCPRYYYDLYDFQGVFQARGITRVFSWGFFFPWGMEIDVYDPDLYIGKIEGQFFTKARAKFVFYDHRGEAVAIAYLNHEAPNFLIVSAYDEAIVLAELQGKTFGDITSWEMETVYPPLFIDQRLLKIFASFVADYHNEFTPPPKEVHHFYFFDSGNHNE